MKSLEFANEYRNITVKSMNDYIDNCDKYGQEINECYFNILEEQLAHFDIIKQDLEVLEIIKEKKVDVDIIWILMKKHKDINDILWYYNFLCLKEYRHLTLEELLKLKQWLEVNEGCITY